MKEKQYTYRQYTYGFFLVVSLLLFGIGLFNYYVDPYGLFQSVEIVGINQQKEGVRAKIRYVKALELSLRKPKTIIIGSSRVHDGINPDNVLLQKHHSAYNLGIDMLRMHEGLMFLQHAICNSDIKEVIFGIDFFMFNSLEVVNPAMNSALVGRKIEKIDYLSAILSSEAISDSLKSIKVSFSQPGRKEFISNGYRPAKFVFYQLKDYGKLHYYTNWTFLSPVVTGTPYYANYEQNEEVFNDLDKFLEICKDNNIKCTLFISPAHANLDGEAIKAAGLWGEMENFKRKLVIVSNKYDVTLWDFSGYNSVTTEAVQTPMKYYWDSSHFSEIVGGFIISRMFDEEKNIQNMVPYDFGRKLTIANIENELLLTRMQQLEYEQTHGEDVKLIQKIYRDAATGNSAILVEKTKGMF